MELVGQYFSVLAFSNVISVFVHFGLLQAVPLMDEDELKVGVTILSSVSLAIVFLGLMIAAINSYPAFVLIAAGVLSLSALIETILIRDGLVNQIAVFRIFTPLISFSVVLLLGILLEGSVGLIVGGYTVGLAAIVVLYSSLMVFPLLGRIHNDDVTGLLKNYSNFPRFIGPGLFFHSAAYNLPSIIGLHFFGGVAVAAYNLAYKFVLAPMTIVGKAIGQAYISKLSRAYRNKQSYTMGFRLDAFLFGLGVIVSMAIFMLFPIFSRIIFPEDHESISSYAIALIPIAFSMLAVSPLSNLLQFTQNQKKIFMMHVASFLGSVVAFGIAIQAGSFILGVTCFSFFILARYAWLYIEIIKVREG